MNFVKAGFARVDITPQFKVELSGYGPFLERKYMNVHDPLYAQVAVFQSKEDLLFLFSCDLVGLDKEITEVVRNNLRQLFNSKRVFVSICCTHTHSGPSTVKLYGWGEPSPLYWEWLKGRLLEGALHATNNFQQFCISVGKQEVTNLGVNREVNGGPVDKFVRFIQFKANSGKCVVFLHHAMHSVVLGRDNRLISADWPGAAIRYIKSKDNDVELVFFFQGAAGEINTLPACLSSKEGFSHIERIGSQIGKAVMEGSKNLSETNSYQISATWINRKIELAVDDENLLIEEIKELRDKKDKNTPPADIDNLKLHSFQILLDKKKIHREKSIEVEISAFRLGDLIFVFHPGETSLMLADRICKYFPKLNLWVTGYTNDYVGYIPPKEYFENPASYPAYFVPRVILGRFPFQSDIGDRIVDYSKEVVQKLL